ncbi:MAG: hypothetical protein WCF33_03050, partial [Pseudonocardiaceae bacterium]
MSGAIAAARLGGRLGTVHLVVGGVIILWFRRQRRRESLGDLGNGGSNGRWERGEQLDAAAG